MIKSASPTHPKESPSRSSRPLSLIARLIPAPHPFWVFGAMLVASLIVCTRIFYPFDLLSCFIPWGQASGGWRVWDIYRLRSDCNYPPFCLYLFTLVESLRRLFGASPEGLVSICLVKLPFILAHLAGALVCYYGLRRPWGGKAARRVAVLYAFSTALYVNAAQWGQADTLVSLAMVSAAVLLARDRPVLAGAAMGWALAIKLQAIVIAPVLLVYTCRRYGIVRTLAGVAAGLGILALISLPIVLGGGGRGLLASYTNAAGYYPHRTLNAMNLWGAANSLEQIRNPSLSGDVVNSDIRPVFASAPHFTYKHLGLLLLAAHQILLLALLWRRPTRDTLLLACALSAFGFFCLPTQMHERYIVPAAALFALTGVRSVPLLILYFAVTLTATWNQSLVLHSNYLPHIHRSPEFWNMLWGKTFFPVSLLNCALLIAATLLYCGLPAPAKREESAAASAGSTT